MIYYFTPYATDKNIGSYYNDCMAMIPKGSWACFTDGDAMFTVNDFGHQLEEIIEENPDYSLFTSMTNRVGTNYQCWDGAWHKQDMPYHRTLGAFLKDDYGTRVDNITDGAPLSGVLMLVNKDAWFHSDRFQENGMLGIDNSIHYSMRNSGKKVGLMRGVYMLHWYRGGIAKNKQHLM